MAVLNINVINETLCCCRMFFSWAYNMARCIDMHCFAPLDYT